MPIKKAWSLTDRLLREAGSAAQAVGRGAWEIDKRAARDISSGAQAVGRAALGGIDAVTSYLGGQDTTGPARSRAATSFTNHPDGPPKPTVSGSAIGVRPGKRYSGSTTASVVAARDTQDRQGRFSAPSPDRLRERATPNYNEMTYSQPDLSSVGRGDTKSGYPTPAPARHVAKDPSWRGGSWTDQSNVPLRQQAAGGPSPSSEAGKRRRTQSTESAFRSADASMFNSTVTPKAAPIKDYKPRGKTVRNRSKSTGTDIQAFY